MSVLGGLCLAGIAKGRRTKTHGRWPWVAAVGAPPATVALYENRRRIRTVGQAATWGALPLLLWHQTEEWVLPAGFLPWFNRSLWASGEDEFPLTPEVAFRVNVLAGWGVSLSAAARINRAPWLASAVLASHVANGVLHVGAALSQRRYNPGLATAPAMGAVGAIGTASLIKDHSDGLRATLGAVAGLAFSAALPLGMRRRIGAA